MPVCFVIQPFDFGKFDKRYADVYQPAIKAAGLEPYRVDRDPGVDVAIEAIEEGCRAVLKSEIFTFWVRALRLNRRQLPRCCI